MEVGKELVRKIAGREGYAILPGRWVVILVQAFTEGKYREQLNNKRNGTTWLNHSESLMLNL